MKIYTLSLFSLNISSEELKRAVKALTNDMRRAYVQLIHQWLDYMRYLKDNYPFLFSLSMRTNPFDQEASPIVQ